MEFKSERRNLLKMGVGAAASAIALGSSLSKALGANQCGDLTPAQTAGPFYPGENQFKHDSDLTATGAATGPLGQKVIITGTVSDTHCKIVTGANVEIWQACASGRYNNPTDTNTAPLDPNFKYWGETVTDEQGAFMFKTIIPGAYPADTNWVRPPHIHFKVSKLGFEELITQMYFKGQPLNEKDLILEKIPRSEWSRVVVDFQVNKELFGNVPIGNFNITLKSIR